MRKILMRLSFLIIILLGMVFVSRAAYTICADKCTSFTDWYYDSGSHWQYCEGMHETFNSGSHSFSGATCVSRGECSVCGYTGGYGYHSYRSSCPEVHCSAKICSYCGKHQGACGGGHSYTSSCSQAHCTAKVCSICGEHKGSCGGGHTYSTCSHCGLTYCNRCTTHTPKVSCPCNNDMSCSDPHCAGITWCSYCGTHSCVGCDTNAICREPHCYKEMCSVCGAHNCTGGHNYEWETDGTGETQTHIYICNIDGCGDIASRHSASWGSANASHTSKCKKCNLRYTHEPVWSTAQRSATAPHPCAWWGGCSGTHTATWGEYYKANGGTDGDSDGGPHTRKCSTCGITEIYHNYSTEEWNWVDTKEHKRSCKTCGLSQTLNHNFTKFGPKDVDSNNHSELYKHWKLCTVCDPTHKEVDELHEDNGNGICSKCGQILWKIITDDGDDITTKTVDEESALEAFREAKREEIIKILEVVDNNGSPKIQYIKSITGPEILAVDSNNKFVITQNGEYEFTTGRGGIGTFIIDNISREILIDKILNPITSTTGSVKITVRTNKSEESYNKEIYIKEGKTTITDEELNGGSNPYSIEKTVDKNGVYYFTARDTAGNVREIAVVVDNIIKGQATVAISNDVFIKGYIFTEILVNPNEKWNLAGNANDIVKAKSYKIGNTTGTLVGNDNIKLIKVMDMQRKDVTTQSGYYLPGAYYIQVAIGGSIFDTKGTYIIDLENINLPVQSKTLVLQGKNRIIVEVQDLKDLT